MTDIVPGIIAAVAFVAMWSIHVPLVAAAILSAATYFGIRFLMPAPKNAAKALEDPIAAAASSVAKLRQCAVAPAAVQAKLNDVCAKASALISYFASDKTSNTDAQFMVQQYLALLYDAVARYSEAVRLSGGMGGEAGKSIVELLDGLAGRFGSLLVTLRHEDDTEISNEIKALNQTLTDMDSLTQKVRGDSS